MNCRDVSRRTPINGTDHARHRPLGAGTPPAGTAASWPLNLYQTAVGKKYVMAITGVGLLGFVVVHMIGNLHIYEGPTQVHEYAEAPAGSAVISCLGPSCCGCSASA